MSYFLIIILVGWNNVATTTAGPFWTMDACHVAGVAATGAAGEANGLVKGTVHLPKFVCVPDGKPK